MQRECVGGLEGNGGVGLLQASSATPTIILRNLLLHGSNCQITTVSTLWVTSHLSEIVTKIIR